MLLFNYAKVDHRVQVVTVSSFHCVVTVFPLPSRSEVIIWHHMNIQSSVSFSHLSFLNHPCLNYFIRDCKIVIFLMIYFFFFTFKLAFCKKELSFNWSYLATLKYLCWTDFIWKSSFILPSNSRINNMLAFSVSSEYHICL